MHHRSNATKNLHVGHGILKIGLFGLSSQPCDAVSSDPISSVYDRQIALKKGLAEGAKCRKPPEIFHEQQVACAKHESSDGLC